jgi:hypothetical protein
MSEFMDDTELCKQQDEEVRLPHSDAPHCYVRCDGSVQQRLTTTTALNNTHTTAAYGTARNITQHATQCEAQHDSAARIPR